MKTKVSFILLICCTVLTGCTGYRIGAQTLYDTSIRTVYVPMFESDSYRQNFAERLTEAVCKKIEARTPFKVVGRPSADSVLSGKLISDTQAVVTRNEYHDVRQKKVILSLQVVWADRKGNTLQNMEPIPLNLNMADITSSWNMVPEMGDSTVLAQQRVIDQLADQIVDMMQEPWTSN
ncbi:MAG: LPS assembly lipoprotein LptE [Thermoguttaceae bacterium]